jgi:plasmid maintenance system antidote protein VapI
MWQNWAMPTSARTPPGPLTEEITALLREHIARKRWTQVTVANAATIPTSTFSDIINGQKPVDIEQLDRICWAVGYPIEELVRKAEENTQNRQTSKTWKATRLSDPS